MLVAPGAARLSPRLVAAELCAAEAAARSRRCSGWICTCSPGTGLGGIGERDSDEEGGCAGSVSPGGTLSQPSWALLGAVSWGWGLLPMAAVGPGVGGLFSMCSSHQGEAQHVPTCDGDQSPLAQLFPIGGIAEPVHWCQHRGAAARWGLHSLSEQFWGDSETLFHSLNHSLSPPQGLLPCGDGRALV